MNISTMSREELEPVYRELVITAAQLRDLYCRSSELLGQNHEASQSLWLAYVSADEAAQPARVRMGQLSMQEQIDQMSAEEFEAFRQLID